MVNAWSLMAGLMMFPQHTHQPTSPSLHQRQCQLHLLVWMQLPKQLFRQLLQQQLRQPLHSSSAHRQHSCSCVSLGCLLLQRCQVVRQALSPL